MKLSDLDRREFCSRHGWVGRRAFQLDRHDLCEAPCEDVPADDADDSAALDDGSDENLDDNSDEILDSETVEPPKEPPRSRAAARRQGIPPKKTLAVRRITQLELAAGRAELQALGADDPYARPKMRGDCQWCPVCQLARDGKSNSPDDLGSPSSGMGRLACGHRSAEVIWHSRPCVFVACKQSLFLDVSETGSIILNFPHLEPGQMPADQSCALDLAERGAMTLEDIAVVTNLTRERIRQVELKALVRRARPVAIAMGLGPEDGAALGDRHRVGPHADLEETGVDGDVPIAVDALLISGDGDDS